jgi:hypothetical protein
MAPNKPSTTYKKSVGRLFLLYKSSNILHPAEHIKTATTLCVVAVFNTPAEK